MTAIQLAVMATLLVLYRISPWHPLATFPGPLSYKITNLRYAEVVASGWRHKTIRSLHEQYGDIVRIGPNSLSINSRSAIGPVYASAHCMDRSSAYSLHVLPGNGLFFMLERESHNSRRNQWAPAFSNINLGKYEKILDDRVIELTQCIGQRLKGRIVNIAECIEHWSYDFMGDFAFGQSSELELMKRGDPFRLVENGKKATALFDILGEVPWLMDILWYLPSTASIKALHTLARGLITRRELRGEDLDYGSDISSYLIEEKDGQRPLTSDEKTMDALFAIQAGSDTTANVLQYAFFFILSHDAVHSRLRKELEETFPDRHGVLAFNILAELPYLNAVIQESLRLGTPLSGLPRVTPTGGSFIDGSYIPGNTVVSVPNYAQQLDPRNFCPHPEQFIPERWLPGGLGEESKVDGNTIMSFSFGPFGCIGRNLAMQELRIVIARLLLRFQLALPEGFDPVSYAQNIKNIRTTFFPSPLHAVVVREL
ncbi:cytochrome P450 [Punctularia strigosozonata HHB-11173 SS5]|uniref:cytochrome P450 n=1 Tax=Punctularia strigosozonata (strain HHB-11173) TaxID=741275 RepID=UPI0004417A44|nr:cytochrome P450 [Punctularia strigosozonata HHB-11173 SS5]EIN11080.1 cytochrome P450 [Punctularia strigosozonata HHB-11173 SS5]